MKTIHPLTIASALFLAGCCTPTHLTKWEYKVVGNPHGYGGDPQTRHAQLETFLNDLGKDGWVLVNRTDEAVFYFKRPVR